MGLFTICFLGLLTYYTGFAATLEDAIGVPAMVWVLLLFLVRLYFLLKPLDHLETWTLVVSAVNVGLIVILSFLAFTHLRSTNLFYVNLPFLDGRSFDPAIVSLVFGVILTSYFGHMSVINCAQDVLRRDPSMRSLMWGTALAQATVMILYCLFVLAINGAITSQVLMTSKQENPQDPLAALIPLAAEVSPILYLLGSTRKVAVQPRQWRHRPTSRTHQ